MNISGIVAAAGCMLLLSSCTRVEIPLFTSIECSADPVGPPVTDARAIEAVSQILQRLPGDWRALAAAPGKPGVAIVLSRGSQAVSQIVIGSDWIWLTSLDHRGIPTSPGFEKGLTTKDRETLLLLSRGRAPNQPVQPTPGSVTPRASSSTSK